VGASHIGRYAAASVWRMNLRRHRRAIVKQFAVFARNLRLSAAAAVLSLMSSCPSISTLADGQSNDMGGLQLSKRLSSTIQTCECIAHNTIHGKRRSESGKNRTVIVRDVITLCMNQSVHM
jgi:hypothetical protein